jgi:hypothetical protein
MAAMFVNGSAQNEQFLDRTIIDASYQASLHLAEGFQRRRLKCEKLTDDTHLWQVLYNDCSFRPDRYQTWPPQAILVSDRLISKKNLPF